MLRKEKKEHLLKAVSTTALVNVLRGLELQMNWREREG